MVLPGACATGDDAPLTPVTQTDAGSDTFVNSDLGPTSDSHVTTTPSDSYVPGVDSPAVTDSYVPIDTGIPDTYAPDTYVPQDTYSPPPPEDAAAPCTATQTVTGNNFSVGSAAGCIRVATTKGNFNCSNVSGCTLLINGTAITIASDTIGNTPLPTPQINGSYYFDFSTCDHTYAGCSIF